ncbi:MAG TPA: amino acid adenylation domain-containing protein, partial [Blastocatellia bacterium]|nr:amino acid adenylation domain-containing protein [Blastocatellia bacterium]
MALAAGFQALLSRYSGQLDVAIGTDVANRNRSEVEPLIGFFVNQLVLRCRLDPGQSFRELLRQVREVTLGAYEHQDLPFEKLVSELALERDMSRAPLSQVKLTLQNTEQPTLNLDGLQVEEFDVESGTVKVDLQLMLREVEGRLEGALYYATDLYESATAQRILGHLEVLLKSIAANPDRAIRELPLMSEAERDQLLKGWSNTETAYREAIFVHQMFQRQAELNPDAVALVFDDRQMSYGDLNRKANRLAHFLRGEGVGPESIVAVYLDRSMELVVALIAVLKAGAAYVPIEAGCPAERAAYMLKDAAAKVVISKEEMRETVDGLGLKVVSVDGDREEIGEQSEEESGVEVSGENAAYVIYTSGSTGKPKGVCVTHNDLIRLFKSTERWFNFDHKDVWTLFHSYAFDFSVWEMWGALLYGGRLVVVPYWISRSPDKFLELIKRERVTVLNQTPSAFRQLIQADGASGEGDLSLRLVIFGGEALDLSSLRPWFERHPDDRIRLVNMYGITETTVHVTYRPIKSADTFEARGSVIGGPIPDLQVYLLDDYLNPVPIGFPGQIYVGGAGLARGYLNRPGLTADRFIPNPFSDEPGARLYKSGDLARFLPGGDFEYLGRADHQVKIRGFRIELGEIEAALVQHPGVREAVVLALDDTPSQKRLVGYIVAKDKELATAGNLRKFLQKLLPEILIPSAFVLMESFPLTSNGKLDRASLPAPSMSRPGFNEPFVPPQNEEEELLAKIWGEVIGVDQVGSHDNFFALGGDSIRSIQVLYRAEQQGLHFTFQQLFQHQTIHELAESIKSQDGQADSPLRAKPFGALTPDDLKKLPPNVEDAYPLASLQAGMVFHSEFNDNVTAYHDVFSYHLRSPFSECEFRRAAEEIIARHPVLRTSFDLVSFSRPLQIVHADSGLSLEIFDLRGMAETQQEADIREWVDREKHRGFDWRQAPLLRFYVHRRGDKAFQLTVSFHHSILDGWSLATMLTEMFQRYFHLLGRNVESPPPPPKSSYRDFIALEQEAIESERARRYWEEKLDAPTVCRLPRLRPQPGDSPSGKGRAQVLEVPISDEVSEGLSGMAQRAGLPLKSICLAVHLKVLSLLTGQSDILTGLVSNGRLEEEDGERVLGLFLNTVPLRQRLQGGTWLQLAEEAFAAERELLPFRRYPLAHLSKASELFEVAFNYVHFHVYQGLERFDELQLLGSVAYEETNFTLMVNFVHSVSSSRVQLSLNYDASALSEEEINIIGKYYARGLEAMAAEPAGRYELASLLSSQERGRLLIDWNDTRTEYGLGRCLHNWVEDQVERTPESTALIFGRQSLDYRELNARANQLAHHLKNIGVSAGDLVGICLERSVEMVVGLLGILKAGAGYLPLDPAYPKDRLAYILDDARPSALLTRQDLAEALAGAGTHVIALDAGWDAFAVNGDENPNVEVQPDDVAYAIYTSGSTGRPKGVLISHRGICNRLLWMQDSYQLSSADSILQKTPYVFDVSVWEFFWPLMTGARLVIARPEGHKDSRYLIDLIVEQQITTLHFVPPMLQAFLEEEGVERCKSLRQVICSGEALSHELQERFHARLDAELHNLYGPTEASVDVTYWRCERSSRRRSVPIGFPIANTQIYILDQHLQLLPAGVAGQLHIAGTGLAHGYLNRADLTAEAFIPNPYSEKPGDRLYRTGDLARHLPDGSIEYLGRIDHQVKIRGFRVELGEIQNTLLEHGSVREAVVVAHEDGREVKRLVACVVPDREAPPAVDDLVSFLKQRLPEYMIPSAFVLLDAIPLSSNGKVDRKSLLALDAPGPEQSPPSKAPSGPVEMIIGSIWRQLLKVDSIDVRRSFFELGGDSLLAMQMNSRLMKHFKVDLPLQAIFETPTIAALALRIEQAKREWRQDFAPRLARAPRPAELPLSYAQQRLWFLDQLTPRKSLYNMPGAVRLKGALNLEAVQSSLNEIVRRHEILRTSFPSLDGKPQQHIAEPASLPIHSIDFSTIPAADREEALRREMNRQSEYPFDLSAGPLLRVCLLRASEDEHVLLVVIHHIVSDGWSVDILLREFDALYRAFDAGQPSPLPELSIQYADYAVWQREWLRGEVLELQMKYWRQRLAGASALQLPADFPREERAERPSASFSFQLSENLYDGLKEKCLQEGVTLFMMLLAAFQTLLHRYSGQSDIVTGSPAANRNRFETEDLIGCFINPLALRTDFSDNPEYAELLARVRETVLGAHAHQDVPFDFIVDDLAPARDLTRLPLFQTWFVLHNLQRHGNQPLSSLSATLLPVQTSGARLDLALEMVEGDQLRGVFVYAADLFRPETIARMAEHFDTILQSVAADPNVPILDIPLEQQQQDGADVETLSTDSRADFRF